MAIAGAARVGKKCTSNDYFVGSFFLLTAKAGGRRVSAQKM
jgi:hypothetical protein